MGATENNELEYQIIETAKQLFIEKGFVETSMSDIAAKVGINRPTLHYYFRTKDRMFQAVFGSIVMSLLPKVQEIIQQELPFIDRVSLILDKYITLFTENPDMPKFICGEIQRDVNHLLDAAKEMQFEETFLIIKERLLMEMEAGRLKKVPIHTIFITFYGLLTFPLITKNLITSIFCLLYRALPARGRSVTLTSPYSVEIRNDSVISYLPYYGRAYSIPYGGGEGLNFKAPLTDYKLEWDKKETAKIKFSARSEEDKFDFIIDVFSNGSSSIFVNMQNRQSISFQGELDMPEEINQ